jgi:hypothetical protein
MQRLRISPPGGKSSNWKEARNTDNSLGDQWFADGSTSWTVVLRLSTVYGGSGIELQLWRACIGGCRVAAIHAISWKAVDSGTGSAIEV